MPALAVDDDAGHTGAGQRMRGGGRVRAGCGPAVGDDDQQRAPVGVTPAFSGQDLPGAGEPGSERGAPAGRQGPQPRRAHLHAGRRREDDLGARTPKRDHSDPVAALVGVQEQGKHGRSDRAHPGAGGHGTAGVHHEQHEVALASFPYGAAAVGRPQDQPRPAASAGVLPWRGRSQGRRQVQAGGFR